MFPYTGIILLFGAFVFIFVSLRLYKCWERENNYVAKLFSWVYFLVGSSYLFQSPFCLLLVENQNVWRIVAPIYFSFLLGAGVALSYILSYLRFQKYTRFVVGFVSLIAISCVAMVLMDPPFYFFSDGALDWNVKPIIGVLSSLVLIITCLPVALLLFFQAKKTENRVVKIRALGLGLAMCWLIFPMVADFFFITFLEIPPIFSDVGYFISFLILLITVLLTWTSLPPKYRTKVY